MFLWEYNRYKLRGMITPYNILRHELIGLEFIIAKATHPGYLSSGTIINETRNTLLVRDKSKKIKRIPKNCIVLRLKLPARAVVEIDGNLLISRPEDRVKKKYRIKFV